MAVLLRCKRVAPLTVAFCFLPFITSSLHLEDPNVCSHWERWVVMLQSVREVVTDSVKRRMALLNVQSIFWIRDFFKIVLNTELTIYFFSQSKFLHCYDPIRSIHSWCCAFTWTIYKWVCTILHKNNLAHVILDSLTLGQPTLWYHVTIIQM